MDCETIDHLPLLTSATTSLRYRLGRQQKRVNGSALRYEQKPPPDVEDPSKVLRDILRLKEDEGTKEQLRQGKTLDFDGEDVDISFGGLSLSEFLNQESTRRKQAQINVSASDRRRKFEEFHKSISDSDQVLKSVEVYLTNFKAELGQVSAEIESLQTRSTQLNAQLENRRQVEKLLGPAVEDVSISPVTVRAISDGPINDGFIKALTEVEARSDILEKKTATGNVKVMADVKPLLGDLKTKAVERIRDFLVGQIKALRSPNINAQVIQQQNLIKYKDLFAFLARQHAVLADEITQAYINTMKWYYSSHFTRYQQALQKMQIHTIDPSDLIGADPSAKKNVLDRASRRSMMPSP